MMSSPKPALFVSLPLLAVLLSACHRTPDLQPGFRHRVYDVPAPRPEPDGTTTGVGSGTGMDAGLVKPGLSETDLPWARLEDDPVPPDGGAGVERRWEGVVYFAYDQSFIGEAERPKLETLADYLQRHEQLRLIVEGHCDERGSEEYNRGLGERRALAVRDYLNQLGVATGRVETISYGEEKLADPGETEAAHARNRRAEFVIVQPSP
jgi:peptidoglycan-associated lipoprotein